MGVLTGLRQFNREHDGITIFLRPEEWPADVPLPPQSDIRRVGENHEIPLYPQWRFVLEADNTVEVVTGLFRMPLTVGEIVAWYETELGKQGWLVNPEKRFVEPTWASLTFEHPATKVHVSFSMRGLKNQKDTSVTIWRVLKHPYAPPAAETVEAQEAPLEKTGEGD